MKIKIWTLHIRDRWGGDAVSVHYSRRVALECLLDFHDFEDDEASEVRDLITDGHFDDALSRIDEFADASGHEWSIDVHVVDTEKAEVVT